MPSFYIFQKNKTSTCECFTERERDGKGASVAESAVALSLLSLLTPAECTRTSGGGGGASPLPFVLILCLCASHRRGSCFDRGDACVTSFSLRYYFSFSRERESKGVKPFFWIVQTQTRTRSMFFVPFINFQWGKLFSAPTQPVGCFCFAA